MTMRILSLSGGGIRGLFQAVFLRELASRLNEPLHSYFDLLAGTSTGSIIALGVALNIDLGEIVQLFETKGPEIFPEAVRRSAQPFYSYACKGAIYDPAPLRKALDQAFTTRTGRLAQLKDCLTPIIVPATTLDRYRIRSFTTFNEPDLELFATHVALASAAAPLYFPPHQPHGRTGSGQMRSEERSYMDGGIWANNPALHAVTTAHRILGTQFHDMRVISVGNGEIPAGSIPLDFGNLRRAMMMRPVFDMMFSTQSELADETVGILVNDVTFSGARMLRINVDLTESLALDDANNAIKTLKPLAETAARDHFGQIKSLIGKS